MNSVTVWTDNGETWSTGFNGTEQDAINYFLGQTFNRGPKIQFANGKYIETEDHLVLVNAVLWRLNK